MFYLSNHTHKLVLPQLQLTIKSKERNKDHKKSITGNLTFKGLRKSSLAEPLLIGQGNRR